MSRRLLCEYGLYVKSSQSISTLPKMTLCLILYLAVLVNFCTSLSTQEIDGLVYTEEELGLDRVEKHIFVWKMDLEESRGGGSQLELMLAKRLMVEGALLVKSLRSYAVKEDGRGSKQSVSMFQRGGISLGPVSGGPALPAASTTGIRESKAGKRPERRDGAAWIGGYTEGGNGLRRTKRNVFGDIMHQLFGVATDEQLQQQLRVDEELRGKVTDTLTRQVMYEKELTQAIGNITAEEDRMEGRLQGVIEQQGRDRERSLRMDGHRFTLMEDVDRLEDILEAVVTGVVNTRHSAYLSSKAGLSRVASFEYLNLTVTSGRVSAQYLTRLYREVEVEVLAKDALFIQLRTPEQEYYLHVSHSLEMPLTEHEVRRTRDECSYCAVLVHLGSLRYLAVRAGNLTCVSSVDDSRQIGSLAAGEVIVLRRTDECQNEKMSVSVGGRHLSHYIVSASGTDPLDTLMLRRRERLDQRPTGGRGVASPHAALNMHLRQNLGMAQQDIENLIAETQESFKLYTVTSSSTAVWLLFISVFAIALFILIVRKCRQRIHEQGDNTVFVPAAMSC